MGNAFHHLVPPTPRFSLGKLRSGTVACLCLWASAGLSAAVSQTPDPAATAASSYRQASESFNKEDYSRALDLLDHAPEAGKPGEQADVWNLRGAIYLHQHRYDQARAAFTKAIEKDPGLWAARFNLAEINFRQGKYAESSKQFEELLGRTSRWTQSDEHGFLQYKLLLTQMLAGRDKAAQAYLDEHRGDRTPPLMYYYLNAALEHHRGHGKQAEAWLAQADAHYTPANAQVFAESFRSLGWYTERSERLIAAARRRDSSATTPANMAVVELLPGQTPAAKPAETPAKNSAALALPPAATPPAKPAFRTTAPPAPATSPGDPGALQMPAPDVSLNDLPANSPPDGETERQMAVADAQDAAAAASNAPADSRGVYSKPIVLGRPAAAGNKPKATPAATPSAAASTAPTTPAATPAAVAATPPPKPPKPEFTAKYEQAYVQFLQKNYAEARKLLDDADAIQPGQTTSVNLRAQIFKHFYETAYAEYKQRSDYLAAIAQLDEADITQPNQPDALNLRGLTFSKLKKYDEAESAFHRAIQADPQFWAARFNYAELPFNYRNYTAARSRFEELSAQTDASKQPREVELTQFKIFLTLLLEGKVDGARSFMGHLSFSNKTPARYFCQAALEFYAGSADKAQVEIDSANKEFVTQPKLVDIFKESFYRIGWLNDPGNPISGPPPTAASSPSTALAEATPPPATPAATPVLAMVTPAATPAPSLAVAQTTPMPSAQPSVAETTPAPSPAATPVIAATDTPAPLATPAGARPAKLSKNENLARLLLIGFVLITTIFNSLRLFAAMMKEKARRTLPVKRSPLYVDEPEAKEPDEIESSR